MNEDKATRYHRLNRRAGLLSTLWTFAILAVLLVTGASASLRNWALQLGHGSPSLAVIYLVLALSLLVEAATLPFTFYRGFLLERRYGLATQKVGHWLFDHFKATVIGLVFAMAGASFVYFTIRHWPERWWLFSGVGYAAVIVSLVILGPVVLLPIFYRFKPLERRALRDRLTALAGRAGTSIIGVYEWTLSDRTRKANAALTGMGNTRRILLSDTLLADYSDDEIEVILAHELAHHVYRDIWTSMVFDLALMFGGFFITQRALEAATAWLGLQSQGDPAGLPLLLITAGALAAAGRPAMNALSRLHERRADAYALKLTRNPSAFVSAMRRLGQQNLAEENPSAIVRMLFYTHPPIKERLRAAQESAG